MPQTVVSDLLANQSFSSFAEISLLSYPGIGSFRHQDIVSALERASDIGDTVELMSQKGTRFSLRRLTDGKGAALSIDGSDDRLIADFGFLDPDEECRLKALSIAEEKCWPRLKQTVMWRTVLAQRPLSQSELIQLITEVQQMPSQSLAVLEGKWRSGTILGADDFFPKAPVYYAALAEPPPSAMAIDEWFDNILLPDLRLDIERSLIGGLQRVFALNIDPRLSPVRVLDGVSDQALLDVLNDLVQTVSPFTLLGVLEVSLARVSLDGRFAALASDALDRLFGEKSESNGVEASWKILPAIIKASLGRFATEFELWWQPTYWRRLVAHAHANILVELLSVQGPDVDQFVHWVDGLQEDIEVTAHFLDLRDEPLWRAWELSPRQIRATILIRLGTSKGAIEAAGLGGILDSAIEAMKSENGQIDAERPGPMVNIGARMADMPERTGTEDASVSEFLLNAAADLALHPTGEAWKGMSVVSRLLRLDKALLDSLAEVVRRITLAEGGDASDRFLESLFLAADIAATQPDEKIAQRVADTLVAESGGLSTETEVVTGLRILVIAAGAFRERNSGMKWMAERVSEYAFAIPRGLPCRRLLFELEALQILVPIQERFFGRARMIAASGAG